MPVSRSQRKDLKKLGLKLKKIRLKKGLTLKELGYRIDKEPQSISRIEMGQRNPTFLYLKELCAGLEIEISQLLSNK
jgi:transcriptional regulator with XRE-family HTH domain